MVALYPFLEDNVLKSSTARFSELFGVFVPINSATGGFALLSRAVAASCKGIRTQMHPTWLPRSMDLAATSHLNVFIEGHRYSNVNLFGFNEEVSHAGWWLVAVINTPFRHPSQLHSQP